MVLPSARKRQLQKARNKKKEAKEDQEAKKRRLEEEEAVRTAVASTSRSSLPLPSPASSNSSAPPQLTSPPTTSQQPTASPEDEENQEELNVSRLNIRESLLPSSHDEPDSDNETVIITKKRLQELVQFTCHCQSRNYVLQYAADAFESTITMYCELCAVEKTSKPASARRTAPVQQKNTIFKTNVGIIYLSIIDDFGLAGARRLLGVLGMQNIGNYKYYRYLEYIFAAQKEHYREKQQKVIQPIRKYYAENTTNVPDEDGILNIDISYDGSWMKRGHTSNVGMGVIIEVCTGFVVDYEVMSRYCMMCTMKGNQLKKKKITNEEFTAWKTKHQADCTKNFEGSSGAMEPEGARRMFGRSEQLRFNYE